jgi:hypothetical protein
LTIFFPYVKVSRMGVREMLIYTAAHYYYYYYYYAFTGRTGTLGGVV